MTQALNHERLFDAIRRIKGSGLTQAEVDAVNAVLEERSLRPPTVAEFFSETITTHEGVLSLRSSDNGNYQGGKKGDGKLVGSQYGVTAPALARFKGVSPYSIDVADIRAITRDLAVQIGVKLYYTEPGFALLPWNRVTASIVDKAWGSGPAQAIKLIQRLIAVVDDGKLGSGTAAAYAGWIEVKGEEACARAWCDQRIRFDTSLGQPEYLNGWNNRSKSFLPGTKFWEGWMR